MEFRLTYQGLLLAESSKGGVLPARATHKQRIRQSFHRQLKQLWNNHPFLKRHALPYQDGAGHDISRPPKEHTVEALADRFTLGPYKFVPLITADMGVLCSVDVLFLRNDPPGSAISAGDIDNRLKTLFDALTMPNDIGQLGQYGSPQEGEDPFFCLLEDDKLITRAAVETDTLLEPVTLGDDSINDARVIVKVKTSVYHLTPMGMGFLG